MAKLVTIASTNEDVSQQSFPKHNDHIQTTIVQGEQVAQFYHLAKEQISRGD